MRDVVELPLLPMPVLKNLQMLTWDDLGIFDPLVQNGVLAQHLTSDPREYSGADS